MRRKALLRLLRFYPPLFGAGIRITHRSPDMRSIDVEMKLHWWNANYVGTHYGGSLYSMTDPFYMLMLLENLGSRYIVWDKAATIRFRKPGRGRVRAQFRLTQEQLDALRAQLETQDRIEPTFSVDVIDEQGEVVASVEKRIYIRKKERAPAEGTPSR